MEELCLQDTWTDGGKPDSYIPSKLYLQGYNKHNIPVNDGVEYITQPYNLKTSIPCE